MTALDQEVVSARPAMPEQYRMRATVLASAQATLDLWQSLALAYPFQWTALWPLIDVLLVQDHLTSALTHVRRLLDPTQRRLPDRPTMLLTDTIQTAEQGRMEIAQQHVRDAIDLAQELGYL